MGAEAATGFETARAAGNRKWLTLAAVTASLFMVMVDTTIVNVALPSIQSDLDVGISRLEWTVNAFLVVYAGLLLTGGRLADFFGRRRMFLIGLGVFTLASLGCALASTDGILIATRAAQGVGAAMMLPATHALIAANFEEDERGLAYGIWAGVSMFGLSLGPLVGGLLIESLSWRWIFYVNVPFGAAALVFGALVIRESREPPGDQRLDVAGLVTASLALFALVFGLTEGNGYGWTSPTIVATLALAAASFVAFIVVELRQDAPLLDLSLFRNRTFSGANSDAFLIMLAMLSFLFFGSLYLQGVLGYSPIKAGASFLPTTLLMMMMAPVAGKTTDGLGPRWPITAGMAFLGTGLLLLSRADASSDFVDLLPGLAVAGIGIGLAMAPTTTTAIGSLPVHKAGVASGVVNTFRQTGGALGIAITGAIFASQLGDATPGDPGFAADFVPAFHDALRLTGVLALAGAVIAAVFIRLEPEGHAAPGAVEPEASTTPEAPARSFASTAIEAFAAATAVRNVVAEDAARAARATAPVLVAREGPLAGRRFQILGDLSIGRRGTVRLDDDEVSRNHALVRAFDGVVEIIDLGSLNGTFVNGDRIEGTTQLADRDVVTIGGTSLQLEVPVVTVPAALVIADGPLRGRRFPVSKELWLGREAARVDVLIDDAEVSRRHAVVRPAAGGYEIADAGSFNGTFVNGQRIEAPTQLTGGDVVRLGDTSLRLEEPAPRSQGATRVAAAVRAPAATAVAGAAPAPPAATLALVVKDGPLAGRRFDVAGELSIGREGADITIDDGEVSRRHARVRAVGDGLEVVDEGSVNGTYVNGARVDGRALAARGDVVRVGRTSLGVEVATSPRDAQTVITTREERRDG